MTKTHGNTHGGDKWGKATLKSELEKYMSEYMLVLQCTRETLAIAQYDQAQDCSNYECTNY
jgi:molybdenum-dependent DNA-binding transcriptional regulator ModE